MHKHMYVLLSLNRKIYVVVQDRMCAYILRAYGKGFGGSFK